MFSKMEKELDEEDSSYPRDIMSSEWFSLRVLLQNLPHNMKI
jgi:hypothetical protein